MSGSRWLLLAIAIGALIWLGFQAGAYVPRMSPNTTMALKLNRRPPFTTLATRRMSTTLSVNSNSLGSIPER